MSETANKKIGREFARYALPAVTGMVMSSLYTVVDGIFVGRGVGELALGAVNIVYPFIMLQIALTMLIAIGGANRYSMAKARGEDANSIFTQSLGMLTVLSLVINLAAIVFGGQVARLLGADSILLSQVKEYLFWMAAFGIAFMPGLGISIFVRNDNAPSLEMVGTLLGAATNIVLDYLFIMRFDMGVGGAAIASGLGQMISVAVYLSHFARKKCTLKVRMPKFSAGQVGRILYNGVPSFLMEFSQSAIAYSFNLVLMAKFGAAGVASYSVVMYVCSMFNMVLIGVVQGAQPILSFKHGAGDLEGERRIYHLGIRTNLVCTTFFYGVIFLFGGALAGLFSQDNHALVESATYMMKLYFTGFFPIGVSLMNILYFQATEKEGKSILISGLRCVGFVQLFLFILPGPFGMAGICLSLLCGELCNCVISMILYRKSKPALTEKTPVTGNPVPHSTGM